DAHQPSRDAIDPSRSDNLGWRDPRTTRLALRPRAVLPERVPLLRLPQDAAARGPGRSVRRSPGAGAAGAGGALGRTAGHPLLRRGNAIAPARRRADPRVRGGGQRVRRHGPARDDAGGRSPYVRPREARALRPAGRVTALDRPAVDAG